MRENIQWGLIILSGALILLTGCERREKDEPQRNPGSYFFDAPCTTLADGSRRCSDVR